ncbi:hypothetical protein AB6735_16590 [Mucilaginibacter sp. RCC_168]|uniref:hypothetical protein n=1 Tax=Mucilaginibacter sp. RCC_168 TaxID=3239221 RepID=UPI003523B4F8
MEAFITYDGLPLSSGGAHHLRTKSPHQIYASTFTFLEKYTDSIYADKVYIQQLKFNLKTALKYSLKFGMPSFEWNNFLANGLKVVYWPIYSKNLDKHINHIAETDELSLHILWKFKFIDFNSKEILPGQNEIPNIDIRLSNSQIYISLSALKSTASAWFAFPFSSLTADNLLYIQGIQELLPFKFSKYSWRLWKKSKSGKWIPEKFQFNSSKLPAQHNQP